MSEAEHKIVWKPGDTEAEMIKELTRLAIVESGGNITRAARSIGINRTTLRMRLQALGLLDMLEESRKEAVDEVQA